MGIRLIVEFYLKMYIPIAELTNTINFIGRRPLRKHSLAFGSRGAQPKDFRVFKGQAKEKNQDGN